VAKKKVYLVRWCNGSITDFDSVCTGSNPVLTTKIKKMKKILGIFSLLLIMSCDRTPNVPITKRSDIIIHNDIYLQVVIIDSCEYFFSGYKDGFLTHKGNCKNYIHKK